MKEIICAALVCFCLIWTTVFVSSCSGSRRTTVETTEVNRDAGYYGSARYGGDDDVEVTRIEEVSVDDDDNGIFGIIGDILALPFRAVASIL